MVDYLRAATFFRRQEWRGLREASTHGSRLFQITHCLIGWHTYQFRFCNHTNDEEQQVCCVWLEEDRNIGLSLMQCCPDLDDLISDAAFKPSFLVWPSKAVLRDHKHK